MSEPSDAVLSLDRLSVRLPAGADRPHALSDVTLSIASNEIVCVVGESGSGKSMMANAIMRLLPNEMVIDGGRVMFEGRDLAAATMADMRKVRGERIAMIFQEPMTALNPLRTIGDQIGEMFSVHTSLSKADINAKVLSLLSDVHIPDPKVAAKAYPHELSGGQRQRAMIAMALALDPKLLIADEPTTALDVTTQAQILKLIRDLQQRKKTAVLFITHDFGVVAEIADRVVVMQHGAVVEQGAAANVLNDPQHAYTRQTDRRRSATESAAAAPAFKPEHPDDLGYLEDLSHRWIFGTRRAGDTGGQGRLAPSSQRSDARHCRGVRIGKIDAGALHRPADRP
jgi:peptide/nickel transport system ATP-binding protein